LRRRERRRRRKRGRRSRRRRRRKKIYEYLDYNVKEPPQNFVRQEGHMTPVPYWTHIC
jgi:hypothetical protein